MIGRLDDWQPRLDAFLNAFKEDVSANGYLRGTRDCVALSCGAIHAISGTNIKPDWLEYTTRPGALELMAAHGVPTIDALADMIAIKHGLTECEAHETAPGDIAVLERSGLTGMGTRIGNGFATLCEAAPNRLIVIKTPLRCWRVSWL